MNREPLPPAAHLGAAALAGAVLSALRHRLPSLPQGNLHDGLPAAWQAAGAAQYPNDLFVEATLRQPTLWWHIVISSYRDIATDAWWLWLLVFASMVAFAGGVAFLARCLGGGPAASWLAVMAACGIGEPLAGANSFLSGQPSPGPATAGIVVFALGFAARGRMAPALLLCGLAGWLHLLNALHGLILCAGMVVGAVALPKGPAAWLRAGGAALPLAGAVLWAVARGEADAPPAGWADAVRGGHAIHYDLFRQPGEVLLRTAGVLLLLGAGAHRLLRVEARIARALVGAVAAWALLVLVQGVVRADWLGARDAIVFQPLRATAWLMPLAGAVAGVLLERGGLSRPLAATLLMGLMGFAYLNWVRPFRMPLGQIAGLLLLLAGVMLAAGRALPARVAVALALLFPLVALSAHAELLLVPVGLLAAALTPHGWLLLLAVIGAVAARPRVVDWVTQARGAALLVGGTALAFASGFLLQRGLRGDGLLVVPRDEALVEAAAWMRVHLPPEARLQGDPRIDGLRTLAQRPVFFEGGDDHALYLRPSLLPELHRRARIVGVPLVKSYGARPPWDPPPHLVAALRAEGVTHLVLPAAMPRLSPGPVVFENGRIRVEALAPMEAPGVGFGG